jgi:predicted O-methyltransferase YrrM
MPRRTGDPYDVTLPEPAIREAMAWAEEIGVRPVPAPAGAALRLLAAVARARTVVEIGTGTGASGVWLLRGMRPDGVLTTIDLEPEHQRLARRAYAAAGFAAGRTRVIAGRALDVLPRLADGGYDLLFADATSSEYAGYVAAALRLLRPGGLLVLHGTGAPDPAAPPADPIALRALAKLLRESDAWLPAQFATGNGLIAAVKR